VNLNLKGRHLCGTYSVAVTMKAFGYNNISSNCAMVTERFAIVHKSISVQYATLKFMLTYLSAGCPDIVEGNTLSLIIRFQSCVAHN